MIAEWIRIAETQGFFGENAEAKVCQDLILKAISESDLSRNATIKGGVVMRSLSHSARRATLDLDVDFIRYSIENDSIDSFIRSLNCLEGVHFERKGPIEELRHQDYHGKRVVLRIVDKEGEALTCKLDLGVHKDLTLEQEFFCFEVACYDGTARLLINSKEQMAAEKTKALLRFGPRSTRFKDVFDLYFLLPLCEPPALNRCIRKIIFEDSSMREKDFLSLSKRIQATFQDKTFLRRLMGAEKNWIGLPTEDVLSWIIRFFKERI